MSSARQFCIARATGQTGAYSVAVDGTSVCWSNSIADGAVMKVALDGGSPTTIALTPGERPMGIALEAGRGIAVDTGNIY